MRLKVNSVRILPVCQSVKGWRVSNLSVASSNKRWLQHRNVSESSSNHHGFFIQNYNGININRANIILPIRQQTTIPTRTNTSLVDDVLTSKRCIDLPVKLSTRFRPTVAPKLPSQNLSYSIGRRTLSSINTFHSIQPILLRTPPQLQNKSRNSRMLSLVFTKFMSTMNSKSTIGSGTQGNTSLDNRGIKQIKVNACGQLYSELQKTKPSLYGRAPANSGIDFNVEYYDSLDLLKPEQESKAPVVCLLHGAPGNYQEFSDSINYFTGKGFRVVAPNFPDYSYTFEHSFRHSPPERLEFLLNFFQAIQIKRIDMLIGHSSAVYTLFELVNHSFNSSDTKRKIYVGSIGLFNTPTYNLPENLVATPIRMFTLQLFDYPLLRPIIIALIHTFVRIQGIRNRVERGRIDNLLIAASSMGHADTDKIYEYLKIIRKCKVPTFALIGCNDKLIPMRCFNQLKQDLGIKNDKQVKHYNANGDIKQNVEDLNELVEVSEFESGGHYTFQRFSRQVNEDINNFLIRKVLRKSYMETTKL